MHAQCNIVQGFYLVQGTYELLLVVYVVIRVLNVSNVLNELKRAKPHNYHSLLQIRLPILTKVAKMHAIIGIVYTNLREWIL